MSIDKRTNGKYLARWREFPSGPQKSKQFDRKIDAQRFLTTIENAKLVGSYVDPAKGKITLRSYGASWFERMAPTWGPATRRLVESTLRLHVYPTLGERPLASLRKSDVEAWAATLKLAPSTVATMRQHLGQVLTGAVEDGLIPRNPALGARLPRVETKRAQPLSAEQLRSVSDLAPRWFGVAIPLALGLGLRQAEARGLTVDRVDFLRRVVRVDRQLINVDGAYSFEAPKTPSSFRTIPLPGFVGDAIAAHLAEFGPGDMNLILRGPSGRPLDHRRFERAWSAIRPGAIRYHDLRHTFAATLLSAGVSVKAVADWLGHASPTVTLDVYAHLMPVDDERARTVLDGAFALEDAQTAERVG